jgi:hypothetical protein
MTIAQHDLVAFLIESKLNTYATQGDDAAVLPLLPGSKQLEYRRGDLFYRDIYFGFRYFIGQETVYQGDTPVWSLGYGGEVIDRQTSPTDCLRIYGFLQQALRQITPERPYRGPAVFQADEFTYTDRSEGSLTSVWGGEEITRSGVVVYRLRYHGGLIN